MYIVFLKVASESFRDESRDEDNPNGWMGVPDQLFGFEQDWQERAAVPPYLSNVFPDPTADPYRVGAAEHGEFEKLYMIFLSKLLLLDKNEITVGLYV